MTVKTIDRDATPKLAAMQDEDAHKQRVRGIAIEHGIPMSIADEVAKETAPNNQLIAIIERIERIEHERAVLAGDLKEIYAEAKGNGFDTKIIRKLVRLRKMDEAERMEAEALLASYMQAVGMPVQASMGF